MPSPHAAPPETTPDPIATLIHVRRVHHDWSLAKLAAAARLRSPAYVFHIENGTKTPSPAVARRLATALGLDADLLEAWATSRGRANLAAALEAAARVQAWLNANGIESHPTAAGTVPSTTSLNEPAHERPHAPTETQHNSIAIPILPEGADPLAGDLASRAIETIRVERALLPPLDPAARLVGFRLSAHGARRIPESLRAGDCVVVMLSDELPGPDTPCAMRVGARIEIMRRQEGTKPAHLPPPQPAPDSERAASRTAAGTDSALVGRVVLAIRRWL